MTDQAILDILLAEVKPALGCTGPISVAFAAAAAKDAVGGTPLQVRVLMDKDTGHSVHGRPQAGCHRSDVRRLFPGFGGPQDHERF